MGRLPIFYQTFYQASGLHPQDHSTGGPIRDPFGRYRWPGSVGGGCEQLILTCGPARGVAPRRYQTLPVVVLRKIPHRANFRPRLILSTVVSIANPCGQSGNDAGGFGASQGGWGPARGWLRLRAPRDS